MESNDIVRILHLEDDANDAMLVREILQRHGIPCHIQQVCSSSEFYEALQAGNFDLILSDSSLPGFDGLTALSLTQKNFPDTPFVFVSGHFGDEKSQNNLRNAGATDCVPKSKLETLPHVVERALNRTRISERSDEEKYIAGMERLVLVVQELSLARTLEAVMHIVRKTARELTGADGATFVLREGDLCYYADEDAISPLWKGSRFPMSACISGWAMLNKQNAVIEDIYSDSRIPIEAYKPTFVKSLVMVPIRTLEPIGAIGNYWAVRHKPTEHEVRLLQALADTTAVALENVQVYAELEQRVKDRTAQLVTTNKELESFSYAVSHDLKAPLRHISGFSNLLLEEYKNELNERGQNYLRLINQAVERMTHLTEDLLHLARTTQLDVVRKEVDFSILANEILQRFQTISPDRQIQFIVPEKTLAQCDENLLKIAFENLLSNAWKFTSKTKAPVIELGMNATKEKGNVYFVRDNGAGFDPTYAKRLFGVFQRMHSNEDFPGTGIGLATVQRIIHKHGGEIWAEAEPGRGATFYFTLS